MAGKNFKNYISTWIKNNLRLKCDELFKMSDGDSRVEIGYLEKVEPFKVESRFFPSKVGGKPAWLDLKNIPSDIFCEECHKQCLFLCQIYAPLDNQPNAYHRTLFVFVCRDPECCVENKSINFKVYRCQLPQVNDYYALEEPTDTPDWHPESKIERFCKTCVVCGCLGRFQCGQCKLVQYCSKDHQVLDWKAGHNTTCGTEEHRPVNVLFPEYELVTEEEVLEKKSEKSEEELLKEYEELYKNGKAGTLVDVSPSTLEQYAKVQEDKHFMKFKWRVSQCPDQVVRYERGGEPLWIAKPNLKEIPNCEICGGPRQFEFQILSTLLNYLNVDSLGKSIDWGTLLVYTCRDNCAEGRPYKKEFIWKQDIS